MRKWSYAEPTSADDSTPIEFIFTEEEIIKMYFPYWKERMIKAGKEHLISKELCIEDWVIINWAVEI